MKVKAMYNKGKDLPSDLFFEGSSCKITTEFPLKIDKEYIVYSMTIHDGYAWYVICDENFSYHPNWHPCPLFEIVDNRLSKYWLFFYGRANEFYLSQTIWAFPEWCHTRGYFDRLYDAEEKEIEIFEKYRQLMDLEFPDPSILDAAEKIDDEWLLCPFCIDAWQPNSKVGMVVCPECKKTLHNPLYITE